MASLPDSHNATVSQTWPRPSTQTISVAVLNIFVFVCAVILPFEKQRLAFDATFGQNSSIKYLDPLVWLLAANLISIFSVYLINWYTSGLAGQFEDNDNWKDFDDHRYQIKKVLDWMRILTALTFIPLIATALLSSAVIFSPDLAKPVLSGDTSLVHGQKSYISILLVLTGPVYLLLMLVNDLLACSGIFHINSLMFHPRYNQLNKGEQQHVARLARELSVYPWVVVSIDIPILIGLCFIFWKKIYINDEMFYLGFATGAVAMHVIAANLTSIVIDYIVKHDAIGRSGTIAMSSFPLKPGAIRVTIAFILIGLAAVLYFGIFTHGKRPSTVTMAGMTWAGIGPGFIANEKGYFGNLKLEIKILDDTKARYGALDSRDAAIMITNPDQHLLEHERGLPGKLAWISDISDGADGIVTRPEITKISELKGKKVGLTLGTASEYLLYRALSDQGMSIQDVKLVEVDDQSSIAAAFQAKSLDAAVLWEPLISDIVAKGNAKLLISSSEIKDSILGAFVITKELQDDPKTLRSLISGWQKAIAYIRTNPDEARQIMAKKFNVSSEEMKKMIEGLRFGSPEVNATYLCPQDGSSRLERFLSSAAKYWESQGRLSRGTVTSGRIDETAISIFCR